MKFVSKKKYDELNTKYEEQLDLYRDLNSTYDSLRCSLNQKIEDLSQEIDKLKIQIEATNHENDILKQYYHLDEEPTDEEKLKIRLDLRCHDLEQRILQIQIQQNNYISAVSLLNGCYYNYNSYRYCAGRLY